VATSSVGEDISSSVRGVIFSPPAGGSETGTEVKSLKNKKHSRKLC